VLVHGLPYFGSMFAKFMSGDGWEFRFYPDKGIRNLMAMARYLRGCDMAYQIGGRITSGKFLRVAKLLGKEKIVVHWCGSDATLARREAAAGKAEPWVKEKLHHWSDSDQITREMEEIGLKCEPIPLPSTWIPNRPSPMPSEFCVLVFVPDASRGKLYGLDLMMNVARELPEVRFELVGLKVGSVSGAPENFRIHGHIPDLTEFYQRSSVLWRPARHDGLSCMVLEALGHGRHVLWTYPFPGVVRVASAEEARSQIARLHELHRRGQLDINRAGVKVIAEKYAPERVKKQILARLARIVEE
jgi:hypothetical protein